MPSTSDMNIVLGQGNAIKEVHNVRKQSLELNQQFVAQKTEEKKKEDKSRVQEFEHTDRIEIKGDEGKKKKGGPQDDQEASGKEQGQEDSDLSEGKLIDIKV